MVETIIQVQTFALDYVHIWLCHHSIQAYGLILAMSVAWRQLPKEVRMVEGSILTYIYTYRQSLSYLDYQESFSRATLEWSFRKVLFVWARFLFSFYI